jgi:hypothetical protein
MIDYVELEVAPELKLPFETLRSLGLRVRRTTDP